MSTKTPGAAFPVRVAQARKPSVRVVIPARRAGDTLQECLRALFACPPLDQCEVVVVDDGDNDDLEASLAGYPVQVRINDRQGSAARTRNRGAAGFQGEVLVFIDADVMVQAAALQLLIEPILQGHAEATVGNYSPDVAGMSFAQRYKSLYLNRVYSRTTGFIRNEFWTAFGAVKAEVFWRLGGFCENFVGGLGEDTELGQRLTEAGDRILAVPGACGRHLRKLNWFDVFKNDLRKGSKTVRLFFRRGSPLSDFRHCRPRDMAAVAVACFLAAWPVMPLAGFANLPFSCIVLGALVALYGLARLDLLASFATQEGRFLAGAAVTMHLLDLTRAYCVARGLAHSLRDSLSTSLRQAQRIAGNSIIRTLNERPGSCIKALAHKLRVGARLFGFGVRLPAYVLFFVTHRCDAKCGHCFFWRQLNDRSFHELNLTEINDLARSLGPLLQVTLTGGSPELRHDLPDIAEAFHRHCHPTNMTVCCNGYHTDRIIAHVRQMLDRCPGQRFTIGVSLDGIGEAHEQLRGMPGLFDRAVRTIHELHRLKNESGRLQLTCAICVSGLNHAQAEETVRWVWANLPVDLVKPILVRGEPQTPGAVGGPAVQTYLRLVESQQIALKCPPGARRSWLDALVAAKESAQRELISRIVRTGRSPVRCSASLETAVVYADGSVAGCELRDERLGQLRDTGMNFRRIWYGSAAARFRQGVRCRRCTCYHHCFIAPMIFRSPRMWWPLGRFLLAQS